MTDTPHTPPDRPILLCFHRGEDDRFRYDLPDAVRTELNSTDKSERRRSRRNGGPQPHDSTTPFNHFEIFVNAIRSAEGVLAGSHFPTQDDRFAGIVRAQLSVAPALLGLAYYSAHPDSNQLSRHAHDPNKDGSPEGKILSDPILTKATEDTIEQIADILDRTRTIRSGATDVVEGVMNRLGFSGGADLLRKSPTSDEAVCARTIRDLDHDIVTQITRINELTTASRDQLSPAALPYYDAAKRILDDARTHLNDWRATLPGLPDKSAARGL